MILTGTICLPTASGMPGSTILFVAPMVYAAKETGEVFDLEVGISMTANLQDCMLAITYNTTLLEAIQITRGDFFPPQASFDFIIDEPGGLVAANISLPSTFSPLYGNGTIAHITFRAMKPPMTITCPSRVVVSQTQLFAPSSEPMSYGSVSGTYFWESIQIDTTQEERRIDVYTQKGGKGLGASGGYFVPGEVVHLTSHVTFADWPEQHNLVAFQIINPLGETIALFIAETDEDGYAREVFRIPSGGDSIGTWKVFSSVDIACETLLDTLSFHVSSQTVGGVSYTIIECDLSFRLLLQSAIVGVLSVGFIRIMRKTRKYRRHEVFD